MTVCIHLKTKTIHAQMPLSAENYNSKHLNTSGNTKLAYESKAKKLLIHWNGITTEYHTPTTYHSINKKTGM